MCTLMNVQLQTKFKINYACERYEFHTLAAGCSGCSYILELVFESRFLLYSIYINLATP